ncbi:unnamed protein product [Sympodiomycopsis kandeliae]
MGRKKIKIEPIQEGRNRQVTYLKRKAGLFKKAHELATLTDSQVAVIVFGHNGRLSQFCSDDIDQVLLRYSEFEGNVENKGPRDFAGGRGEDDDDDEEDDKPNDHKSKGGPSGSRRPGGSGGGGSGGGASGGGSSGNNGHDGSNGSSPGEGGSGNYKSHGSDGGPYGTGPSGEGSSAWQHSTGTSRKRTQPIKSEAIDSNQSDDDSIEASRPSSPDTSRNQESSLKAAVLSKNHRSARSVAKSRSRNVKSRASAAASRGAMQNHHLMSHPIPISNDSLGLTFTSGMPSQQRPLNAFDGPATLRQDVLARPSTGGAISHNAPFGSLAGGHDTVPNRMAVSNAGRPATAIERGTLQDYAGPGPRSYGTAQQNNGMFTPFDAAHNASHWMQPSQSAGASLMVHHPEARHSTSQPPAEFNNNSPHMIRSNTAGASLDRGAPLIPGPLNNHQDPLAIAHVHSGNSSQTNALNPPLAPSSNYTANHDPQQQMQAPFPPVGQQHVSQNLAAMQPGVYHSAFAPAMSANTSSAMYAGTEAGQSSSSRCGSVSSASLSMSRPGTDDYNSGAPPSACDTPLMGPVNGGPLSTIMPMGGSSSNEMLGLSLQSGVKQELNEQATAANMEDWLAKSLTTPMGVSAGTSNDSALAASSTPSKFPAPTSSSVLPHNDKMVSMGEAMAPASTATLQELVPGLSKSMNAASHPEMVLGGNSVSSTTTSTLAADALML